MILHCHTAETRLVATPGQCPDRVTHPINGLAADGWEVDKITAAPLATGWFSPGGRVGSTSITDKVHYLAVLRRTRAG